MRTKAILICIYAAFAALSAVAGTSFVLLGIDYKALEAFIFGGLGIACSAVMTYSLLREATTGRT